MQISIIIPTYAPKKYLWTCLDSIEKQTLSKTEFEVILVLNGERQPYEDTINQRLRQYSFTCLLLYSSPKGVSRARNLGMKKAKGNYICFIDDDDWVSPTYLESLLSKASNDAMVVANVKEMDEKTQEISGQHFLGRAYDNYLPDKERSRFANRSFFSSACCKLLPKDCIGDQQFDTKVQRGEDSIFMFGISWRVKQIKVAKPSCIYYVRKRRQSAGRRNISFSTKTFEFLSQSNKYTYMYLKHALHNDFLFYLTRIAGTFYNKFIQKR